METVDKIFMKGKRWTKKTNEQRKRELVGKRFGFLVVEDVVNRKAVCLCDCGNRKEVSIYHLLDGHSVSCGCYHRSKEKGKRHSQWFKDNPDKKEEWRLKIKESCNKEEYLKDLSDRMKSYYKEHPEALEKRSVIAKEWCKNNPDKVKRQGLIVKEWYKNNPDKVKNKARNFSLWCKEHPDKVKLKAKNHSVWYRKNKVRFQLIAQNHKEFYKNVRVSNITESGKLLLKDILNEQDYNKFCLGELTTHDKVVIRCRKCGRNIKCLFSNIFILDRNELKRELPRCRVCRHASSYEDMLEEYISSFYSGECIRNSRNFTPSYELDLYYPSKRIAIEVNGYYWHSSLYKDKKDHYLKYKYCLDRGIRLISIYEHDLLQNKDKLLSFLKDQFDCCSYIPAHKCVCRLIQPDEGEIFYNSYNIEYINNPIIKYSDIYYGLFYNNELVSVMSFVKKSFCTFEIKQCATKFGLFIYGGFSKLFRCFLLNYDPSKVVSYSNNDYFLGTLFYTLGFSVVSYREEILNKQVLYKIKGKTNVEVLEEPPNEYSNRYEIYRCGYTEFVWYKENI